MKKMKSTVFQYVIPFVMGMILMSPPVFANKPVDQQQQIPIADVQRFTAAISEIKNYYYRKVSDSELFQHAIRGMLEGLDPHSSFLDASEFKQLTSVTQGEFGGLGLEVTMENGAVKVISPIDDSPAKKAGIKSGDFIIRLNDTPIEGMSLSEAVKRMRGKKGSAIELTVIRKGADKPLKFHIVRAVIHVKSIKSKLLKPGIGYIRISQFQAPSAKNLLKAVKNLKQQSGGKLKGLVLDLRNNPGGLLDSAVAVSDAFLDSDKLANKTVVYTKTRIKGANYTAKATAGDVLNGAPMVVLINQGSASGAEIVAGALQDHKRAILVGETSFGKGSVQTVLPLDEKTAIKLTTALYYTPNGRSIQATGIKPDIIVDDIKVNKADNKKEFDAVTEANLIGHLKNANGAKPNNAGDENANLVYKDYPLHEALNILEGLVVARSQ